MAEGKGKGGVEKNGETREGIKKKSRR